MAQKSPEFSEERIQKRLEKRIDDYFITAQGGVPSNPKTWASLLQHSLARNEIENGKMTPNILKNVMIYALKKSLQSGSMNRSTDYLELDESESFDVDDILIKRAIAFTRTYIRPKINKRSFPKSPIRWLNVLKSEIHPNFPFAFPEYALPTIANKICVWYNDGCQYDQSESLAKFIPEAEEITNKTNKTDGIKHDLSEMKSVGRGLPKLQKINVFDEIIENDDNQMKKIDGNRKKKKEENVKTENIPVLTGIEDEDLEKMYLLKNAAVHCVFCEAKLSVLTHLVFVNGHVHKGHTKDRIGLLLHYTTKTLSCDWYDGVVKDTKVRCLNCSKFVGWPFVCNNKKYYIFRNRNILFRIGSQSYILAVSDLKKQKTNFVSRSFWQFLKSGESPYYKQTWNCIQCTAINKERQQQKCEFCNYNRLQEDEWACSFCTFFNKNGSLNCQICNSPYELNIPSSKEPAIKDQKKIVLEEQKGEYEFINNQYLKRIKKNDGFTQIIENQSGYFGKEISKSKEKNLTKNIETEEKVKIKKSNNDNFDDIFDLFSSKNSKEIVEKEGKDDLKNLKEIVEKEEKEGRSEKIEKSKEFTNFDMNFGEKFEKNPSQNNDFSLNKEIEKSVQLFEKINKNPPIQNNKKKQNISKYSTKKEWKKNLKLGDRIDFRSSPQTLGKGHWIPGIIVQMRKEPSGLSIEILFEGFVRSFEWVPIVSNRIDLYKTHYKDYLLPESLPKDLIKYTSYEGLDQFDHESDETDFEFKENINQPMKNIFDQNNHRFGEKVNENKIISTEKKINSDLQKYQNIFKSNSNENKDKTDRELHNEAVKMLNNYGGTDFLIEQDENKKATVEVNLGVFSNLEFPNGIANFRYSKNLPQMNRTGKAIPKEFKGDLSWGYISPRAQKSIKLKSSRLNKNPKTSLIKSRAVDPISCTVNLYLHTILVRSKNAGTTKIPTTHSFGILLEEEIIDPPIMNVFLHTKETDKVNTNYDGEAIFISQGLLSLSFEQIEQIKKAHCFLYELLCHSRAHSEMLMDTDYCMFLVVPVNNVREIDWISIERIFRAKLHGKMNFIDYVEKFRKSSGRDESLIPLNQLVFTPMYNTHEQHLYSFISIRNDLNAFSQCDNDNARPNETWKEFLYSEHGIQIKYPSKKLVETYQLHPRSQSVLSPPKVSKSHLPPRMNFVQELLEIHPIPLKLVMEMTDIVSIVWGLQNFLSVKQLQISVPVDINLTLLEEAMTFSMANNTRNYELLEFLGDSVLKYLSTDYLFFKLKGTDSFNEGKITTTRKDLISNKTLCDYGRKRNLVDFALVCKFQRRDYIPCCYTKSPDMKYKKNAALVSDKQTADLVESMLGATFLTNSNPSRFSAVVQVLQWFGSEISLTEQKDHFCLDPQVPLAHQNNPVMAENIELLQRKIGYSFKDKRYAMEVLYAGRRTSSNKNNEVLEVLGDSVLDFLCTRKLFYVLPNTSPEDLTNARKELVCNDALAQIFMKYRFEECVYLMNQETLNSLRSCYSKEVKQLDSILPIQSSVEKDQTRAIKRSVKKIGVLREMKKDKYPKKCGDFVESVIGAIYLDLGKDMLKTWLQIERLTPLPKIETSLALDCEFVGVGSEGHYNALARVSVVDFEYNTIYDKFVRPTEEVIDWRTEVSGIRGEDVVNGEKITNVQSEIAKLIEGRLLIGHNIESDLNVLFLSHPKYLIRDTALFRKFCPAGHVALKHLVRKFLGAEIQSGEHSSVIDARETMRLYKKFMAVEMKDVGDDLEDLKTA